MSEHETLLGTSAVYLFGRQLADLKFEGDYDSLGVKQLGGNNFLRAQLGHPDRRFARIFAFSFEGGFCELHRPTILLVHGKGISPDDPPPTNVDGDIEYQRLARSPGSTSVSGLGWQSGSFAKDIRVWVYDKGDFSMRLDMETGTIEEILVATEAEDLGLWSSAVQARSSGGMARSSGGMARSSGGMARSSGGMARSSGWRPRRSPGDVE